ncbi:MAG TPA: biotin/lipoyl-binding protein, partial [Nitrospiraceae bacterium]
MSNIVSKYVDVWRAARDDERLQPERVLPQGKAAEFLPAVLEIQDAPPSPIGRAIAWTIMLVFVAGIVWSSVGKIDIVAVAQGKVIPSGYSKVIQPVIQQFENGIVAAIHVQDGQVVKKGDVLVELDPTQNRADRDRVSNEHRAAKVEAARLRAVIAGKSTFDAPADGDPQYVLLQQQLLRDQLAEYRARMDA